MLTHDTEQARNTGVVLHLRRAESLLCREEVVRLKQRSVPLACDRACCLCHKRMGGAVSVAFPSGSLAHYLCYTRSTQQQQQQQQRQQQQQQQQRQQQQQQQQRQQQVAAGGGGS
jgi:hypothetical protein